jgi:hypothetical protein
LAYAEPAPCAGEPAISPTASRYRRSARMNAAAPKMTPIRRTPTHHAPTYVLTQTASNRTPNIATVRVTARMAVRLGCDAPPDGGGGGCGRSLLPITSRLYDCEEDGAVGMLRRQVARFLVLDPSNQPPQSPLGPPRPESADEATPGPWYHHGIPPGFQERGRDPETLALQVVPTGFEPVSPP